MAYTCNKSLFSFLSFGFVSSPDARVLEQWCPDSKNTLLGSGDGWLAPPAGHPSAEVVPAGHWAARDERVRPGHPDPQHAHHHVLLLPQQVWGTGHMIISKLFFVFLFVHYLICECFAER